jgi:hypothetical protein
MFCIFVIITTLLTASQAQSTTALHIRSDERIGWVPSEDRRSTLDIIWSCLAVFIVCSWKCVHLNIPAREETHDGWFKLGRLPYWPKRSLRRKWARQVKWMFIIAIAPELGVAMAANQFFEATNEIDSRRGLRGCQWHITHGFYAKMGGYAIRVPNPMANVPPYADAQMSKEETAELADSYKEYELTLDDLGKSSA